MKIKIEALVELTVEVPEKSDTDVMKDEAKIKLRGMFKNKKNGGRSDVDVADNFKIIIIGKE